MIEIYADGAYSSSRDRGGWAFVVVKDGVKIHSTFYPIDSTTNNRMEIQAAIEACAWAKLNGYSDITVYTDSMYVIGTMTLNWKRKKNHDLWALLDPLANELNITWTHVRGHSGDKYNELCDALAVSATHAN
jgi:ribonuclease HI